MKYFVYIIYSQSIDKYYVGYSHNALERLEKHNLGATRSTRPGRPWSLVYLEECTEKRIAIQRENEIKKMKSRKYIESFIKSSSTD